MHFPLTFVLLFRTIFIRADNCHHYLIIVSFCITSLSKPITGSIYLQKEFWDLDVLIEILKKTRRSFVTSTSGNKKKTNDLKMRRLRLQLRRRELKKKQARFGIKSKAFKMRRRMKSESSE